MLVRRARRRQRFHRFEILRHDVHHRCRGTALVGLYLFLSLRRGAHWKVNRVILTCRWTVVVSLRAHHIHLLFATFVAGKHLRDVFEILELLLVPVFTRFVCRLFDASTAATILIGVKLLLLIRQ